mgnify:CR=1 FL=1
MLDINLLSKNVRAKKEKEIERIRTAAPRLADQTKGQKVAGKFSSINFFSRFFKRSAPKPSPEDAAIAAQFLLQTPKEALPQAPPQVPPSPLKPMPVPEVMKVSSPQKSPNTISAPAQPKPAPIVIKKASDGIILPDISSIIQKNIEKPAEPTVPIAQRQPIVPPPPPIKKIEVMPSFEKKASPTPIDKISIGAAKEAGLPKPKPQVTVMPQRVIAKPVPSIFRMATAGILSIAFAASFITGSFFVLNRWVLALEKVKADYEGRTQAVEKIIENADQYAQESDNLAQKTQILYEIFKSGDKNEN